MLAHSAVSEASISESPTQEVLSVQPLRLVDPRPGPRMAAGPPGIQEAVLMLAFGSKDPQSSEVFTFDFTNMIGDSGMTISSATVGNEVVTGIDASPSAMLSGSPQVLDDVMVLQRMIGGVDGVGYHLRCIATMSDSSVLVIGSDFDVREF